MANKDYQVIWRLKIEAGSRREAAETAMKQAEMNIAGSGFAFRVRESVGEIPDLAKGEKIVLVFPKKEEVNP